MPRHDHLTSRFRPHLPFILMAALLGLLWLAGGASRADVIGQVVARAGAWAILLIFILFAPRPPLRPVAPVAFFVFAAAALATVQLVPLPPAVWAALPGRELFEQAAIVIGQEQPWRPLSISPGATVNALSSLIVPFVALMLMAMLGGRDQRRIATLLLGLVVACALVGLLQFSGGRFDHPLINDVRGSVSGTFANRNHFALFAAIGCVLTPAWAFREGERARWKAPVAVGLLLLLALIIMASGSRTGMLVGALGAALGLLNVRSGIARELRRLPRKASIAIVAASIALVVTIILLSITLGRAVSLDRVLALEAGEDLRRQALPTVWAMTQHYFPFGSGIGTFDPVYRIHEPDALLNIAYFNHAHNDLLEIVLDAGLPGLLLLGGAIAWWLWKSLAAWRSASSAQLLPRVGSTILLLTLIASATDYPARTPMIMAVIIIAAIWLNGHRPHDVAMKSSRSSGVE